jgi:predicted molibdopterin-dependent oxidoreductase YjgC
MISLTINGKEVTVPAGTTVLEAARQHNIYIPTLCHDPRIKPFGACRLCIVEIDGCKRAQASCTTPAAPGMVVRTDTKKLESHRKTIVELLLSDHPDDCMVCKRAGDCKLQDLAYWYDLRSSKNRFAGEVRDKVRTDNNPFLNREMDKCILCGLCVRACDEVQGVNAIDFAYRGFNLKVATPYEQDLNCEFCGQCVAVCPTGALTGRMWSDSCREKGVEKVDTTCTYCGCGCNLTLHVNNNRITRISSKPDNHNRGWLCTKGRFGYEFVNRDERLKTPLIRRHKDGELEPATWDEALDFVAQKFFALREEHGADALAGLASARCTNEDNYLFQKLFRAGLGTNNIDHCARY